MWRRYADATKGAWRKKLESNPEVKEFDELCRALQERTEHCIASAENAEKPGVMWERRWEEVAEWVTGVPAREGVYERYHRPPTGSSASSSATSGAVSSAGSSGCMMGGIGAPNTLAVEKSPPPSGSVGIGFAAMSRIVSSTVEVRTSRGDEEIGYSSVAYAGPAAGSARSRFAIWGGRGGRKPRD